MSDPGRPQPKPQTRPPSPSSPRAGGGRRHPARPSGCGPRSGSGDRERLRRQGHLQEVPGAHRVGGRTACRRPRRWRNGPSAPRPSPRGCGWPARRGSPATCGSSCPRRAGVREQVVRKEAGERTVPVDPAIKCYHVVLGRAHPGRPGRRRRAAVGRARAGARTDRPDLRPGGPAGPSRRRPPGQVGPGRGRVAR